MPKFSILKVENFIYSFVEECATAQDSVVREYNLNFGTSERPPYYYKSATFNSHEEMLSFIENVNAEEESDEFVSSHKYEESDDDEEYEDEDARAWINYQ